MLLSSFFSFFLLFFFDCEELLLLLLSLGGRVRLPSRVSSSFGGLNCCTGFVGGLHGVCAGDSGSAGTAGSAGSCTGESVAASGDNTAGGDAVFFALPLPFVFLLTVFPAVPIPCFSFLALLRVFLLK